MSPRQQADAFLRSVRAAEEGGNELGIEGGMRAMSMTPSPNIPQPPPPPQVSPNPNFTLPQSCEERGILGAGRERSIHEIERGLRSMSITPSPNPPKPPPPTPSNQSLTLPQSLGQTESTLVVDNESLAPEVAHPIGPTLTRPSPHGTPARSTPGEPSGSELSCEGVGNRGVTDEGEESGKSEGAGGKRARRGKQASRSKRRAFAAGRKEEGIVHD